MCVLQIARGELIVQFVSVSGTTRVIVYLFFPREYIDVRFFIIKQLSEKVLTMQIIIAETGIDSEH